MGIGLGIFEPGNLFWIVPYKGYDDHIFNVLQLSRGSDSGKISTQTIALLRPSY